MHIYMANGQVCYCANKKLRVHVERFLFSKLNHSLMICWTAEEEEEVFQD